MFFDNPLAFAVLSLAARLRLSHCHFSSKAVSKALIVSGRFRSPFSSNFFFSYRYSGDTSLTVVPFTTSNVSPCLLAERAASAASNYLMCSCKSTNWKNGVMTLSRAVASPSFCVLRATTYLPAFLGPPVYTLVVFVLGCGISPFLNSSSSSSS